MNKIRAIATALALAIGLMGASAAASAAEPMKNVQVGGKVIVKSEMKDGKASKSFSMEITSAKGADGKAISDLVGKTIALTGAKAAQLDKDANQHALVRGTLAADRGSMEVDSYTGHSTPKKTDAKKKAPAPTATHTSPQTEMNHASPAHKN